MGAINFSLDPKIVTSIRSCIPLKILVETGTYKGDTVAEFATGFEEIISIELSKDLSSSAANRFISNSHIRILEGNSATRLNELRSYLADLSTLYWLDAHWCESESTAGKLSQCPLMDELKAIGKLNANSTILIDDARLFLAAPLAPHEISHWPNFHKIISVLFSMSSEHELMVINDVIAFFPVRAKEAMQVYAQQHGVDWLNAANCLNENINHVKILQEKEKVIEELAVALNAYREATDGIMLRLSNLEVICKNVLEEKEKLNDEQEFISNKNYCALFQFAFLKRIKNRILNILKPRLGNLNQYAPRNIKNRRIDLLVNVPVYPSISITTPSFGQGAFIERTISSILDQNYPKLEYFVQDGGSTDSTVDILKKYQSQLTGWVSERDSGQSQAINRGMEKTHGEIMAWLNSDDLLLPGSLHAIAEYFYLNPNVDVVYGNRLLIDENDMEIGRWIMPAHDSSVLSWVDYIPQETLFWRRSIWEKAGGNIDESFRFAMDWDLLIRFRDAGAKFARIPHFLGAFRIHEHQKTSAVINSVGFQEMDRIRKRILGKIPDGNEIRKATASYLLKHLAVDLIYRIKMRTGMAQ